jgi:tetratricopeptide (TPR) repeat protein
MFLSHFDRMVSRRFFYLTCFVAVLVLMFTETAWAQTVTQADEILRNRIAGVRRSIETAASWHATEDELGVLWRHLANDYADELDFQQSEDAFAHSLKLLRTSPTQRLYAAALADLASLYVEIGRLKEGESCGNKALAIYEGVGDQVGEVRVRLGLAVAFLHDRRFAESEDASAKALKSLQEQKEPNQSDLVTGLIANSYAKCFLDRCSEALVAAGQAMGIAKAVFSKDSTQVVAALMALGFEEWKTGAPADGEKAMREALELLRQKKNMPYPMLIDAQLKVLTSYTNYLKATHQKVEAKQVENEIARLKQEQTPYCRDCTINVLTLSKAMR